MNIPNSLDIYENERGLLAAPGRYELFQSYPFNQNQSWLGEVNFADAEKTVLHPIVVGWELNLEDSTGDVSLVGSYDAAVKHSRRALDTLFWTAEARTPENWGSLTVQPPTDREYGMKTVFRTAATPTGRQESVTMHNWCRPWYLELLLFGITSDEVHDDAARLFVRATETGWTGSYAVGPGGTEFLTGLTEGSAKFYVRYPGFADVEEWVVNNWA